MKKISRVLILTVAYGNGHKSAAGALAESFADKGVRVRVEDPCEADTSGLYSLSKLYYRFCVRRAPWLWSVAYSQTQNADWHAMVSWPLVNTATFRLLDILRTWKPDMVVCTYPLFAYMMDFLRAKGESNIPCAVVVTDSIEISKPWVKSCADRIFVPDEYSRTLLMDRYGIDEHRIFSCGFPVRKAFLNPVEKSSPAPGNLKILFSVFTSPKKATLQIRTLLSNFRSAQIVVIAGQHYDAVLRSMHSFIRGGKVVVLKHADNMPELMAQSHIYIGKTGAATMFECYAAGVPFIANYALPGQEQGNLELLLRDGCGVRVEEADDLCAAVLELMASGAQKWLCMRDNMLSKANRVRGAESIVENLTNDAGDET